MPLNKTVFVPVDPDTAFALITEPERLRRWKAVAARVDLRVGGADRWTITPGQSAMGAFTEVEPGKRVVYTWCREGDEPASAEAALAVAQRVLRGITDPDIDARTCHEQVRHPFLSDGNGKLTLEIFEPGGM